MHYFVKDELENENDKHSRIKFMKTEIKTNKAYKMHISDKVSCCFHLYL